VAEERRAREGAGAPAGPSRRGEASARTVHRPQGMHAGVPSRAAGNPWVLLHAFPTGMSTGRVGSILLLATISISPCCRARDHVTVPARWSCAGLGLRVLARSCAHGGKQVRLAFTLATWHASSYAAVLADQRQNLRRPLTRSMHMQHTHAAAAAAMMHRRRDLHACSITRCSLWTAGELRRDPPNRATCMPTFFFFGEVVSIDLDPENNNLARPRAATVFDPHSKWMDQTTHKTS
jgi:hypothetical protein